MGARPAAGGGRWLEVPPERIAGWLAGFDKRHGVVRTRYAGAVVTVDAADGAVAECHPPFPPVAVPPRLAGAPGGEAVLDGLAAGPLVEHALRPRTVGVLLARLGGHAAGVFQDGRLVASKVGSRQVQGRTAAGGWSQHRFARRREGQAAKAAEAAADDAVRVLASWLPAPDRQAAQGGTMPGGQRRPTLDAMVLGGERRAVDALRADRRLARVFALATERFITTADPRLAVLKSCPAQFRAVRIRLIEPATGADPDRDPDDPDDPGDGAPGPSRSDKSRVRGASRVRTWRT